MKLLFRIQMSCCQKYESYNYDVNVEESQKTRKLVRNLPKFKLYLLDPVYIIF